MKIKLSVLIVVALAMWFAVTPALADTVDTFTVSGLLQGNVSFSGTLNINTANGAITSFDIALPAVSGLPALTFTPASAVLTRFTQGPVIGSPSGTGLFRFDTGPVPGFQFLELALIIPEGTLAGFAGAEIVLLHNLNPLPRAIQSSNDSSRMASACSGSRGKLCF